MRKIRVLCSVAFLLLVASFAHSQDYTPPPGYVVHPNQEIRINLPTTSASSDSTAALAIIFHDPQLCCGVNSALRDAAVAADPLSLKDIANRLQGEHALDNGRWLAITTNYLPSEAIHPNPIIETLIKNQAALFEWNSHLYVLYGAVFDEKYYDTGGREFVIHKLLLLDTRFSGARRETFFDRAHDDWKDVQGLLILSATTR